MKFKKGDIVGRISYDKDIIFVISNLIKIDNNEVAILKGLVTRIVADSPVDDLELIEEDRVIASLKKVDKEIEDRSKSILIKKNILQKRKYSCYGRILHLDGDKKYSEKSQKFYRSMGLDVVVKNIPERKQPQMISYLLGKYNPDILVVTRTRWNDKKRT